MMKRIVAMLLFVAMAMTMLAACNGTTTPGTTKGEVNFKVPETGFDAETPITITFMNTMGSNLATVLEAYIAEFEAMFPNIDVQSVNGGGYDDVRDTIVTEITVGGQPNIIEEIQVNGVKQTVSNKVVNILMATKVSELENDSNFQSLSEVNGLISAAVEALKIGDYAKAADLTTAVGRIAALEANVDKWNAAEQNAKDYADGLNTTMDGRVQAVEGNAHEHANKELLDTYTQTETNLADAVAKKHEHENAGVLNGITAEKVAAWDAAEQNAKDYTDELEGELSAVAKSGNVNDLIQTTGDVLILDCGNSEA